MKDKNDFITKCEESFERTQDHCPMTDEEVKEKNGGNYDGLICPHFFLHPLDFGRKYSII